MDKNKIPTFPTYDQIHEACEEMGSHLGPVDMVIGLSRGGLLPGVIVSHLLNIPFKPIEYSSTKGKGDKAYDNDIPDWIKNNSTPTTCYVVDDLVDSGHSLSEVTTILQENNFITKTVVMYYKTSSIIIPDYYKHQIPEDFGWIVFPYEISSYQ